MKRTILHGGKLFPGLCMLMVLLLAGEVYAEATFAKKIIGAGNTVATILSSDGAYVAVLLLECQFTCSSLVRKTKDSGARAFPVVIYRAL